MKIFCLLLNLIKFNYLIMQEIILFILVLANSSFDEIKNILFISKSDCIILVFNFFDNNFIFN